MRPLDPAAVAARVAALPGWTVSADRRALTRRFALDDFDASFALATRVAAVARALDHHPDMRVGWGYAAFELTTHAARGLTDADFALAARIDEAAGLHA